MQETAIYLSKSVAEYLGENLTNASITRFADDEVYVEIKENIRGEDVFVMGSLYLTQRMTI